MSKKLLSVGVTLALVAAVFAGVAVSSVGAQAMSLCQTVDALVAAGVIAPDKVAAAKAAANCGSAMTSSSYTFTKDLTIGSTGADVSALQAAVGVSPATGYFGPITQAAVKAYQTAHGISATGFVGPLTRASLNAAVVVTPPTTGGTPVCPAGFTCSPTGGSTGGSTLSGGAGDINDVTLLGTPNSEAVGEGEDAHKVVGFEIEADNGSDIAITSAKVEFDRAFGSETSGSSTHINDYISGVSVWEGSKKVGSADIEDFSKTATGVYSKSISLSGATVQSDKKVRFYVTVDGENTVDTGDMPEQWGVRVASLRFTDGTGANLTNNLPDTGDTGAIEQYFTIESEADASNAKLVLTESSDNPKAGVVQVDDGTDTTDGVVLLKGKIKAEGSSLWIDEIPVLFTTSATNVTDDTASVTLTIDGQEFSESTDSQDDCDSDDVCTVTFDKLDITVDEGQSLAFEVSADVNGVGGDLTSGDTLKADVSTAERDAMVVEVGGEEGDDLGTSSTDRVGSVTGEDQGFYNQGITVTPGSMKATAQSVDGAADYSEIVMNFSVTAIGEDIYLDKTVTSSTSTSLTPAGSSRAVIVNSSGTALALTSAQITSDDNDVDEEANTYKIPNGTTGSFTMTLNATGTNAQVRGIIYGLEWDTDDNATGSDVYNLDMGVNGSYKTSPVYVSAS